MTAPLLSGTCPECETELSTPPVVQGETLSCPECLLTLRVDEVGEGVIKMSMVEVALRDWGQ